MHVFADGGTMSEGQIQVGIITIHFLKVDLQKADIVSQSQANIMITGE